ncbi:hypothetical protein COMA2_230060 [Candidatus Nitrospira nitrificans]|uniref:Uncharacterized protein n=1 Tax=Candidatus Nitrospira nitrificans TaxID=1742973 RepID=A0A0S4LFX1_9BACT|nr:hypothetical protein COMA2_230060 [Candidatus Nitrospira nitrificans]
MVLWQDPDAHVPGQCALGEGKNPSGVNPVRTRCLSDEVLTYTAQPSILYRIRLSMLESCQWRATHWL